MSAKKMKLTSASHSDFLLEALRQIAPSAFTEVRAQIDAAMPGMIDWVKERWNIPLGGEGFGAVVGLCRWADSVMDHGLRRALNNVSANGCIKVCLSPGRKTGCFRA